MHKFSSEQQFCGSTLISFIVRENWTILPLLASGCCIAGWQTDQIWVDFQINKILYKLNYLDYTSFNISAMLL